MKGLSSCFACEIKGCLISAGSFIIQLFAGMVADLRAILFFPYTLPSCPNLWSGDALRNWQSSSSITG